MVEYKMVDGESVPLTEQEQAEYDSRQAAWPSQYAAQQLVSFALKSLSESDKTMLRTQEAISLGLTTWTTPDVVAWMTYRRALREIVSTKTGVLPDKPNYPSGT